MWKKLLMYLNFDLFEIFQIRIYWFVDKKNLLFEYFEIF